MKLLKYIAPRALVVNGDASPCECTETITCSYCVQAKLSGLEKKFKTDESATINIVAYIKRNGIRKTARELNVYDNNVRYWLKTKNVPHFVMQKYAACANQ